MSVKTDKFKNDYADFGNTERMEVRKWIIEFEGVPTKERKVHLRKDLSLEDFKILGSGEKCIWCGQ